MPMRCSRLARMTARAALVALALVLPVVPAAAPENPRPRPNRIPGTFSVLVLAP